MVFFLFSEGDAFDQIGHCGLSAVCNGAHVGHILAGIDLVSVLADTCPRGFIGRCARQVEAPGGSFGAVEGQSGKNSGLFDVFCQRFGAKLGGNLRKGDVTGVGQRFFKALGAVHAAAYDGLCADLRTALAISSSAASAVTTLNVEPGV